MHEQTSTTPGRPPSARQAWGLWAVAFIAAIALTLLLLLSGYATFALVALAVIPQDSGAEASWNLLPGLGALCVTVVLLVLAANLWQWLAKTARRSRRDPSS